MLIVTIAFHINTKRRRGTRQVRNGGTGIPKKRNKASPRLYGMSIAQFPRFLVKFPVFPFRGLCER